MNGKRVLVVEDDTSIARMLRYNLEFDGYEVEWSQTGRDTLSLAESFLPDVILLDLGLPEGVDGLDLCRRLSQRQERTPIIIITARAAKEDRVRGLMLGADDYVIKPFALEELLARITALLRRVNPRLNGVKLGDINVDFRRLRVLRGTTEIAMTDREFEVLRHLAERAGAIVSRDELLRLVWGYSTTPTTRTVDNFIFRLRNKLEPDPRHPRYIRTVHGDGYRLTLND